MMLLKEKKLSFLCQFYNFFLLEKSRGWFWFIFISFHLIFISFHFDLDTISTRLRLNIRSNPSRSPSDFSSISARIRLDSHPTSTHHSQSNSIRISTKCREFHFNDIELLKRLYRSQNVVPITCNHIFFLHWTHFVSQYSLQRWHIDIGSSIHRIPFCMQTNGTVVMQSTFTFNIGFRSAAILNTIEPASHYYRVCSELVVSFTEVCAFERSYRLIDVSNQFVASNDMHLICIGAINWNAFKLF